MMFCMHCGKELPDDAKFCAACGQAVEQQAMREHDEEEKVLIEASVSCYWEGQSEIGRATLTNKRFILEGKHNPKPSLSKRLLLGPILSMATTHGESYKIELTADDIADVCEGKVYMANTIVITTHSGESYQFLPGGKGKNTWLIELRNLMARGCK